MNIQYEIKKITILGLILNIIISIIKFILGLVGNSQAVIADGIHSFSDSSTDIAIIFGVKYWTSPPDSKHPFGHQKIESFITISIGAIILIAAIGIGYTALITINEKHTAPIKLFTIIGPLVSIIFKEILFRKTYKIGVEVNSSAVKANAWHHRTDALSSVPVLIAIVIMLIKPELSFLDHIGAIIVAVFIIKVGIEIIYNNIADLMDTGVPEEEIFKISQVLKNNPEVLGFHKIRTRKLGNSIYLDLHLEVNGDISVLHGHTISENVKSELLQSDPKIIDVMIHLEPKET